jgi:hypothetical protein
MTSPISERAFECASPPHKWKIPVPNGLNYWGHVSFDFSIESVMEEVR